MMSDFYSIESDWDLLKKEFDGLRDEINTFLKTPQKRKSGILPRKKSKDLEKISKRLKLNVLRIRQDYQSDYS
jgi:hypothetical protein